MNRLHRSRIDRGDGGRTTSTKEESSMPVVGRCRRLRQACKAVRRCFTRPFRRRISAPKDPAVDLQPWLYAEAGNFKFSTVGDHDPQLNVSSNSFYQLLDVGPTVEDVHTANKEGRLPTFFTLRSTEAEQMWMERARWTNKLYSDGTHPELVDAQLCEPDQFSGFNIICNISESGSACMSELDMSLWSRWCEKDKEPCLRTASNNGEILAETECELEHEQQYVDDDPFFDLAGYDDVVFDIDVDVDADVPSSSCQNMSEWRPPVGRAPLARPEIDDVDDDDDDDTATTTAAESDDGSSGNSVSSSLD